MPNSEEIAKMRMAWENIAQRFSENTTELVGSMTGLAKAQETFDRLLHRMLWVLGVLSVVVVALAGLYVWQLHRDHTLHEIKDTNNFIRSCFDTTGKGECAMKSAPLQKKADDANTKRIEAVNLCSTLGPAYGIDTLPALDACVVRVSHGGQVDPTKR